MAASSISASTYDTAVAVTASDTVNDPALSTAGTAASAYGYFAALWVGTATSGQTVKVTTPSGDTPTFILAGNGTLIPVHVIRVWVTGTNASNILGLVARP